MDRIFKLFASLYLIFLIAGIWHALPNFNVVGDEYQYVAGVLQAYAHHTFIPSINYQYTVSWYASYILMLPLVLALLVYFRGDAGVLKTFFLSHEGLGYYIPRIVTVAAALGLIMVFFKIAEAVRAGKKQAILVSIMFFCSVLFTALAHTGKMWVASLLLFSLSFYFFIRSRKGTEEDVVLEKWSSNPAFYAVFFAFLSVSNFIFNAISFVHILVLFNEYKKDGKVRKKLLQYAGSGFLAFLISFALNFHGWMTHESVNPAVHGAHVWGSLEFFTLYLFAVFPTIIILVIMHVRDFKGSPIVRIILAELALYVLAMMAVAPWAGLWPLSYLRYLLYPGFLCACLLLLVKPKHLALWYVSSAIALIFFAKTIFLLCVPTTYNQARSYVLEHAGNNLVVNYLFELNLPKNVDSYRIVDPNACSLACTASLGASAPARGLFVIDSTTLPEERERLAGKRGNYFVSFDRPDSYTDIFLASNGLGNGRAVSMEYGLGLYSSDLLKSSRLGRTIYVYRKS